jgi:hypothetical protein
MTLNFKDNGFGPYKIQYCLLNNTTLLMIIDKFDRNPILVNINKLKPYMFAEDNTFQHVLVKLRDFFIKGTNKSNPF